MAPLKAETQKQENSACRILWLRLACVKLVTLSLVLRAVGLSFIIIMYLITISAFLGSGVLPRLFML